MQLSRRATHRGITTQPTRQCAQPDAQGDGQQPPRRIPEQEESQVRRIGPSVPDPIGGIGTQARSGERGILWVVGQHGHQGQQPEHATQQETELESQSVLCRHGGLRRRRSRMALKPPRATGRGRTLGLH
jgi:hypothetical protein